MSLKTNTKMTLFCLKRVFGCEVVLLIGSGSPHLDILVHSHSHLVYFVVEMTANLTITVEILAEMEAGDKLEAAFVMNHHCWPPPSGQNWHLSSLKSMTRVDKSSNDCV